MRVVYGMFWVEKDSQVSMVHRGKEPMLISDNCMRTGGKESNLHVIFANFTPYTPPHSTVRNTLLLTPNLETSLGPDLFCLFSPTQIYIINKGFLKTSSPFHSSSP